MKRIKKNLGKIWILLCACLSLGVVANAAGKTSADVEITIETGTPERAGEEAAKPDQTDNDTKITEQKNSTVKTGDHMAWIKYAVAVIIAIALAIGSIIWKKRKGMLAVFALFLTMFLANSSVQAAEATKNVNVTIPTNISISFDESGENSISKFDVNNQSLVPITINKIHVSECNSWSLTQKGQEIPVNTKKLVFELEGKSLIAGENIVSIPIAEQTSEAMDIRIERGAWTAANEKETALKLEFEYTIGKKEFQLKFDTNGSGETIATKKIYNGDLVDLPTLEREGYAFAGWEDGEGNLHTGQFVMPIGDVALKARWKEEIAYAIYSASDTSLRFVRSADPIKAGDTYNGRVVTDVFTGFEDATYSSQSEVPWYDGKSYNNRIITKIVFEDTIKPKDTAYWFYWCCDCSYVDVSKLNMSQVTDMQYMLGWCGSDASTFDIVGINEWDVSNVTNMNYALAFIGFYEPTVVMDLSKWNVSKVTSMRGMFQGLGYYANTISLGDLSKWDVSNVTTMREMFQQTGCEATWYLDLSKWNVPKVTNYYRFNIRVESKVIEPKWVN